MHGSPAGFDQAGLPEAVEVSLLGTRRKIGSELFEWKIIEWHASSPRIIIADFYFY
jgi:hypothetical protein